MHPWVSHKGLIGFGFESFDRYAFGLKEKGKKKVVQHFQGYLLFVLTESDKMFDRIFFKYSMVRSWPYWKLIFGV